MGYHESALDDYAFSGSIPPAAIALDRGRLRIHIRYRLVVSSSPITSSVKRFSGYGLSVAMSLATRSASAPIVREGLTPSASGMMAASTT